MNHTILVVDDQKDLLMLIQRELMRRTKFKVLTASSVEEALRIIEQNEISVVVSDVKLIQNSGFTLAEILHSTRPEIPVLLMSAYRSKANREKARAVGAVAFLEKPFIVQQLIDEVRRYLTSSGKDSLLGELAPATSAISHFRPDDLVQVFCLNGRSVVISVKDSSGLIGQIYIQRGAVQHAEWSGISGDEAFHALLSLESPELTLGEWDRPILQTIDTAWEKLLLMAALKKDNSNPSNFAASG